MMLCLQAQLTALPLRNTHLEWILRISTRAASLGLGNSILRSILPGRSSAASRMSMRLVAMSTCRKQAGRNGQASGSDCWWPGTQQPCASQCVRHNALQNGGWPLAPPADRGSCSVPLPVLGTSKSNKMSHQAPWPGPALKSMTTTTIPCPLIFPLVDVSAP